MSLFRGVMTDLRPPPPPAFRRAANPAIVRSRISSRSISAIDPRIRSASVNAAERLGLPEGTGSIAREALADALLLTSDPSVSIDALVRSEHVEAVFKAGFRVKS